MWFLGLIVGIAVGAAVGDILHWSNAWLLFGALGMAAGVIYRDKTSPRAVHGIDALERRIATLERQVAGLRAPRASPPAVEAASATPPEPAMTVEAALTTAALDFADTHPVPPPVTVEAPAAAPAPSIASAPAKREPPREPSWLWQKLFGGNILAKVGVLLLFFGIASGLKLAIDYGVFPPSVRLLIGTAAGIAMLAFGFSRMREPRHRMFGLAMQGGGFGVLYLITYFALARYHYIEPAAAFTLFAVLGVACVGIAVRFEGEVLAILGLSGAFLAPLLASTGAGSHLVLFSYYAVLDALVLTVYWLRQWRFLTVTAFAFTLVVGMSWALARFAPGDYNSTQAFLVLFALLFSLAPFISAAARRSTGHWAEGVLVFGTPIAAAAAQSWLNDRMGFGDVALAWAAIGAGVYYSALAATLYARALRGPDMLAHGAIAVVFFTAAVPLAFGVQVTSAIWAFEGLALAWLGIQSKRPLAYGAGLLLQIVAGAYFYTNWHEPRVLAVLNATYVGCVIIAACGAATVWMSRRTDVEPWLDVDLRDTFSGLLGVWALAWWLGANFSEIERFAAVHHRMALHLAVAVATAWGIEALGRARPWRAARHAALLLAAAALVLGAFEGWFGHYQRHAMHDTMVFALPAAFGTLYVLLRAHERDGLSAMLPPLHVIGLLVLGFTVLREALWIAHELAPRVTLWSAIAWELVPAALVTALLYLAAHQTWPLSTQRKTYVAAGAPVLLVVAYVAALYADLNHHGGGSGVLYLPVASFFDVAQIAVIAVTLAWARAASADVRAEMITFARGAAYALGFLWLSAMAMRLAHHWGNVPFQTHALLASGMAQSMLSLLWTALALALMISATRRMLRERWFMGFVLLGIVGAKFILVDVVNKGTITWTLSLIGVGLLILAASYFSPAPPRAARETQLAS